MKKKPPPKPPKRPKPRAKPKAPTPPSVTENRESAQARVRTTLGHRPHAVEPCPCGASTCTGWAVRTPHNPPMHLEDLVAFWVQRGRPVYIQPPPEAR